MVSNFSGGSPIFQSGVVSNFLGEGVLSNFSGGVSNFSGGVVSNFSGGSPTGIRSMFGQYASYWNYIFRGVLGMVSNFLGGCGLQFFWGRGCGLQFVGGGVCSPIFQGGVSNFSMGCGLQFFRGDSNQNTVNVWPVCILLELHFWGGVGVVSNCLGVWSPIFQGGVSNFFGGVWSPIFQGGLQPEYHQHSAGTHPTGMHSCSKCFH